MTSLAKIEVVFAVAILIAASPNCGHTAAPVTGPVEVIHNTRNAYAGLEKHLLTYTATATYRDDGITSKVILSREGRAVECKFQSYILDTEAKNPNRFPLNGQPFTELITGRGTLESRIPFMGQLKISPCPNCGFSAPVKTSPDKDMVEFRPGASWSRLLDLEKPQGLVDNWTVTTSGNTSIIKRSRGEYSLCLQVDHSVGDLGIKAWEENSTAGGNCECVYSWKSEDGFYVPAKLERTITFPADAKAQPPKRVIEFSSFRHQAKPLPTSFAPTLPDGWIIYRENGKVQIVGGERNRARSMFRLVAEAQLVIPKRNTP